MTSYTLLLIITQQELEMAECEYDYSKKVGYLVIKHTSGNCGWKSPQAKMFWTWRAEVESQVKQGRRGRSCRQRTAWRSGTLHIYTGSQKG